MSDSHRTHIAFGLGKAYEDLREYGTAFDYFAAGNTLHRKTIDFDIANWRAHVETLKGTFGKEYFHAHRNGGCPDETPVFIVGMLRSGTTLVEQILASHPQVHGAGELTVLGNLVREAFGADDPVREMSSASDGVFTELGEKYVAALREHAQDARLITDKLPGNFEHIGVIGRAMPNAKIVHCRRSPPDNCLSIYKNFFPRKDHGYAYDLEELGAYYRHYAELMDHWREALPGQVYDIGYEELVADQEGQTRALLEHCGLEWDDACLQFHKTDRPVRTVSAAQVRAPIYKDSVELWKRYEKQLAPLIAALYFYQENEFGLDNNYCQKTKT